MSDYPVPIAVHDAVVVGNQLYVVGGSDSTAILWSIRYATIQANGSLSAWVSVRDLPRPLYRHSVAAFGSTLYVTGGDDGAAAQNTVYFAQVNSDGSLGSWRTASLPSARYYHRAVVQDGRLVILGGSSNNTTGLSQVFSAVINADGSIGTWQSQQAMPKALFRHGAVVVPKNSSEYVFVLGGLQGAAYENTIYHSNVPKYIAVPAADRTSGDVHAHTHTDTHAYLDAHTATRQHVYLYADAHRNPCLVHPEYLWHCVRGREQQ